MSLASLLVKMTPKERVYTESRLAGLTQVASAAAAGIAIPNSNASRYEKNEKVQEAMLCAMNDLAEEIGFTRKEAHDMLISAYQNAATAGEQIQAVKELISLHGLAAPKKVEHKHEHGGALSLERMETQELLELADMKHLVLDAEYEDVTDDDNEEPL